MRFMAHKGSVDNTVFITFLKRVLIGATAPVFLIVDGNLIYKARPVKRFVQDTQGRLELFFLPSDSPTTQPR